MQEIAILRATNPDILLPGTTIEWITGDLPQQAAISSFRSSSALSRSNRFDGGLFSISQLEGNGVIFSENDTFIGYVNPMGWGTVLSSGPQTSK